MNGDQAARDEARAQEPVTAPRPPRTGANRRYVPTLETVLEELSAEEASASRRATVEEVPEEPSTLPTLPADSPHVLEPENESPAQFAAHMEPDLPAHVHLMAVDGGVVLYLGEAPATVVPSLTARSAEGLVISVDSSVTSPAIIRQVLAGMSAGWRDRPVEIWLPGPADGRALSPAQAQRIQRRLLDGIGGRFALSFPATLEQTPTEFLARMHTDLPSDVHVMPVDGGAVVYRGDPPDGLVPFLAAEPDHAGLTLTVHSSVTSRAVVRQVLMNLPAERARRPVEVRLPGPVGREDLSPADVRRIASRLFDGVAGQFSLNLPGHAAADSATVRYRASVEDVPGSGTRPDQAHDETDAPDQDTAPEGRSLASVAGRTAGVGLAAPHQRALDGLLDSVPTGVIGDEESAPLPRGAGALVIRGQFSLTDHALLIDGEGYTAAEIARLARAHPGQAVILVAANAGFTGASGRSFADEVAALAPGTDVIAPESTVYPDGDRLLAIAFDPAALSIAPGWHAHSQGQPALPLGADLRPAMSTLDAALSTPAASTPAEVAAMERDLPGDVHVRPVDGGGVVVYRGASPETLVPSPEPRSDGGRTIIVDPSIATRAVIRQVLRNLPADWLDGPVDVRLAGRADGRPLSLADIERIGDRLFDDIDGQFALVLPEEAVADSELPAAARERVLSEVAWSARAWRQPVEAVVAAEQQIRAEAAAKVSGLQQAAAAGDVDALMELAYWQVIGEASAGVVGQAGQVRRRNERVAVAAAQTLAGMQGEESGEQVSTGAAAQFAAGAGAFGWAGYARAWMDVKQTAHEAASAAAQNVRLTANLAALQAYNLALSNASETGSPSERPEAASPAAVAKRAAEQAWAQYAKDAANALPAVGSLPDVAGEAVLAERIWAAVAATQTADAAGVLARAATVSDAAQTAEAPGTGSDTAEAGSEVSDSWENGSDPADTSEHVPGPAEGGDAAAGPAGGGVTWLRAPGDMMLHLQARYAAPRGRGVRTLLAHSDGSALIDGAARLTAEQVAARLGLAVVSSGPDGPLVSPPDPVTVIMLVCDVAGGVVPADLPGGQDLWAASSMSSPAGGLHSVSGQRIVAPVGRAIMLPGGEVIAGTWQAGDPDPVPAASGDWVVWESGVARSLGTPLLSEAAQALGIELEPLSGRAPSAPVDFYTGLTGAQAAALDARGYAVPERLTGADSASSEHSDYSFYQALIAAAGDSLRGVDGGPTPERVHLMVVDEFARDIRRRNPRYRDLISGDQTPKQVLARLKNPASWDLQAARLVPYVAADLFGLELAILGPGGAILPVTDVTGPRVRDPRGHPILLARVGDRRFVPAAPALADDQPAAPADGTHDAAPPPGASPWTAPLSPEAQRLASQEGAGPLPPGAAEPADVGRVAEMRHLAGAGQGMTEVPESDGERVRNDIRRLLSWPGAQSAPAGEEQEETDDILARFDALERVKAVVESAGPRAGCSGNTSQRWPRRSPGATLCRGSPTCWPPGTLYTPGCWVS